MFRMHKNILSWVMGIGLILFVIAVALFVRTNEKNMGIYTELLPDTTFDPQPILRELTGQDLHDWQDKSKNNMLVKLQHGYTGQFENPTSKDAVLTIVNVSIENESNGRTVPYEQFKSLGPHMWILTIPAGGKASGLICLTGAKSKLDDFTPGSYKITAEFYNATTTERIKSKPLYVMITQKDIDENKELGL